MEPNLSGDNSAQQSTRQMLLVILSSTAIVLAVIVVGRALGLESHYLAFLQWAEQAGLRGMWLTGLLLCLSVVFLLPTVYLTVGAGLLFGVVNGAVIVVVAGTTGALCAFVVSRIGVLKRTQRLQQLDLYKTIDRVVHSGGWELVACTRLVPFFPFKLSNYLFGLSSVTYRDFLRGTFVGMWPIALFNAYLGSIAGDMMAIGTGQIPLSSSEWVMTLIGFTIMLIVLVVLARRAGRRLKKA
jgi:uncharacterized membrane protein YdjX (TVP38/TMEM64 family)